jgi:hypothetical protein
MLLFNLFFFHSGFDQNPWYYLPPLQILLSTLGHVSLQQTYLIRQWHFSSYCGAILKLPHFGVSTIFGQILLHSSKASGDSDVATTVGAIVVGAIVLGFIVSGPMVLGSIVLGSNVLSKG